MSKITEVLNINSNVNSDSVSVIELIGSSAINENELCFEHSEHAFSEYESSDTYSRF